MRILKLINDDYLGYTDKIRHASRGIVIKDGKILLIYEKNEDKYIIPGGGTEEGESLEECCEREFLEETGMIVRAGECVLEVEELFLTWQHFQHYFMCEIIKDTGRQNLTDAEIINGDEPRWVPVEEAKKIFGRYEDYRQTSVADYGLYKREYLVLQELT